MNTVIPNQQPMETMEERLRRLTRESLNSGSKNAVGPLKMPVHESGIPAPPMDTGKLVKQALAGGFRKKTS